VWPRKDDPLLQQLLDAWQVQPTFSFAIIADQYQCSVPGCFGAKDQMQHGNAACASTTTTAAAETVAPPCSEVHCVRVAALVLCWADREAAVLHLPSSAASSEAADNSVSGHIWAAVKTVFGDTTRTATCCGSAAAIAALSTAGVQCRLTVDDPCVAFLLWQPRVLEQLAEQGAQQQQPGEQPRHLCPDADVLQAAQSLVLSDSFRLSVPLLEGSLVAAARVALLGRALMPPLRAILVQHQLFSAYEDVERPLQRVFAAVRVSGLSLELSSIQARLQEARQQCAVLHKHASELLHCLGSIDISVPAHVRSLLAQMHLAPSKGEQQSQQPLTTALQHAVRTALRHNQHEHLQLVRCLLTYHTLVSWEQMLKALTQLAHAGGPGVGVALQPLPYAAALCGNVVSGLPGGLDLLLQQCVAPYVPLLASEGSMADLGMTALVSPKPVIAFSPASSLSSPQVPLHDQQLEPWLGMLCAVTEQALVSNTGSPLPLLGTSVDDASSRLGCMRHRCSITRTMREFQLCTSLLHAVKVPGPCPSAEAVTFAPGAVSLLSAARPALDACTFVGLDLQQLPLVVLAALSRDPILLAALTHSDPLAVAAAHWVDHNGMQGSTINMLLSRIAVGVVDGTPVMASSVQCALFSVALDTLVLGQKPSAQRALLGLEQSVDLADTLIAAFPGLGAWREDVLEDCRRTG
jgi:hypothetical protein